MKQCKRIIFITDFRFFTAGAQFLTSSLLQLSLQQMQTDVTIRTLNDDTSDNVDLFSLLMSMHKTNIRFRFEFLLDAISQKDANITSFALENNNTKFRIIQQSTASLLSTVPMTEQVNYFEIQCFFSDNDDSVALSVGVGGPTRTDCSASLFYYNDKLITADDFKLFSEPKALKNEDIIGVVVNLTKDKILFYINGKLLAVSKKKPSSFKQIFANCYCSAKEQGIEIVEKYDYRSLTQSDHPLLKEYIPPKPLFHRLLGGVVGTVLFVLETGESLFDHIKTTKTLLQALF